MLYADALTRAADIQETQTKGRPTFSTLERWYKEFYFSRNLTHVAEVLYTNILLQTEKA